LCSEYGFVDFFLLEHRFGSFVAQAQRSHRRSSARSGQTGVQARQCGLALRAVTTLAAAH
jgi:hypothetical protein